VDAPGHRRSPWLGSALAATLVAAVTAGLVPWRNDITRATPALVLVLTVLVAGRLGGRLVAVVTALLAAAAFNLAFIPPFWTLKVAVLDDAVALGVFAVVAVAVGDLVAREHERLEAAQRRAGELQDLHDRLQAVQQERQRLAEESSRLLVLEQVDQQRAALLRSVSHDLRTPLASIRAVATDLREGADYDEATRHELLALVRDEAERLDRIVANLLSMSRIEAGALEPDRQAIAVDELVAEAARRLRNVLERVRLQVDIPPGLPLADADYSQLDQVLTNLLENAARHAPQRSLIRVGAGAKDGMIQLWVEDEGPGILSFDRDRIFEAFHRGSSNSLSGVGLAMCKAIVEAHGGTISVQDQPGGGSRFMFTVPVHHG